jgi:hypothetical protein
MSSRFGAVSTAFLVPGELWANKSSFTRRNIVPESKERLEAPLQYTTQTTLTAREFGKLTDTSPAMIEHAVRGFLGTMGVYALALADQGWRAAGDYPETPARHWMQAPVIKAFVRDADNPNTRYVREFYELLDKARKAEATVRRLDASQVEAYAARRSKELGMARSANDLGREMAGIRRHVEQVLEDRNLSAERKREIISDNYALIRKMAKNFIEKPQQQTQP